MISFARKGCRATIGVVALAAAVGFVSAAAVAAPPAEKVVLQLKWAHQFQFAGYYAARETGLYRDAGLDVEIRPAEPGLDLTGELTSGHARYLVHGPSALLDRAHGAPIVALASVFQHSPLAFLSLPKSGIRSPSDLTDRRVMWIPSREAELKAMCLEEGVDLDRLTTLPHSWDPLDLVRGTVDAMSVYVTDAPRVLAERGIAYRLLRPPTYGIDFYGDTLYTTESEVAEHPERVRRFRKASLAGWAYALDHPDEVIGWLADRYPSRLPPEVLHFEARTTRELIAPDLVAIGHMNPGRWRHIAEVYEKLGLLDSPIDLDRFLYRPDAPPPPAMPVWMVTGSVSAVLVAGLAALVLMVFNRRLRTAVEERTHAVQESELRARSILDGSPMGIHLYRLEGDDLVFAGANPAADKILGIAHADRVGRPILEAFPDLNDTGVPERYRDVIVRGLPWEKIQVIHHHGDRVGAYQIHAFRTLPGAMAVFFQDVTERHRAQTQVARLATAVAQAAEDVIITDPEGTILYVNPAFERITGYPREEALGQTPRILKSGRQDDAFYRDLWDTIRAGQVWTGRITNRCKDGEMVVEDATISPIREDDGTQIGYVAIKRDVTHQEDLENQLALSQKMEAIGTLAGGIAHDFNNILSAVSGYTELARAAAEPGSKQEKNLTQVLRASDRAADLVRQILTFSRQAPQIKGPVRLRPVVNEALKLLRASLPATVEMSADLTAERPVVADPTQIHQVLMNLCTNAYLAMLDSGGTLRVELVDAEVPPSVRNLPPGPAVRLSVADTGCGMMPETLARVFEPFFTTRPLGQGTGLGLSVVHGIVQDHGGELVLESRLGQGTTFTVWLPAATENAARPEAIPTPAPRGTEHILFVDDEPFQVDLAREALGNLGYRVTATTDSREALERFRQNPDAFDAVITDLTMPRLTGDDLAREILALRPDLPVILCTGYSERFTEEEARALGVREYALKPVPLSHLARLVRAALDGDGQTQAGSATIPS